MKYIILIISLIFAISCVNNKKPAENLAQKTNDTLVEKTVWITENLGIQQAISFSDTVIRNDDAHFAYGTKITLPKLVNKNGEFETLNNKILADFETIIQGSKNNPASNKDEFHQISFDYYLKNNIITIKIINQKAYHLAEGNSKYNIYHFDFKDNKIIDTKALLEIYGWSQVPILNAIAEQITMPPDRTEPLFQTEWFNTVKFSDLNQLKIYQNDNEQIVVIYPVIENGIEAEQILE